MAKKVTLFYGGEKFDLPESQKDAAEHVGSETAGSLRMNLGDGRWLTLATGPGIPAAVLEEDVAPARVTIPRRVR